jgi:ADP-heptose:LPS heptosyltransferase
MTFLVIRNSAMGDVALTLPVLKAVRKRFPAAKIVLLTRKQFFPLFRSLEGLSLFEADLAERHKGLMGIFRLKKDLSKAFHFDHIIDLHDVIRSKLLRWLFLLSGVESSVIDKGRREKKRLIRRNNDITLPHSVERYAEAFRNAGLETEPDTSECISGSGKTHHENERESLLIGIAPFAKHPLKLWPPENMIRLMNKISEKRSVKFLLFGGREDLEGLENIRRQTLNSELVAGKYTLDEELDLICSLDAMIAMDSANMHMAALAGVKTISIWGATDPAAGFGAWGQPDEYMIRISRQDLSCRPCTVYGKGECGRGDFACMTWLTPEQVYQRLIALQII